MSTSQSLNVSQSQIITLTTDFGLSEPFVGAMKGQVLSRCLDARIIDLTHAITPYWPVEAGFWLARSYQYFPRGTIHVAVVDPEVGTQRAMVCLQADGHVFLAPDNGLLAMVAVRAAAETIAMYRIDVGRLASLSLNVPSATFHGRDIFAPLAAELAAGRLHPSDLGLAIDSLVHCDAGAPTVERQRVAGIVITVDHFGNLISNIDASLLSRFKSPLIRIETSQGTRELLLRRTYGDGRAGDYLALVNSFQVIEIARVENSAAKGLGLGHGAPIEVIETC
jgi:S-adenosyl-L-methionine hydrolase (adenosine-forming)